MGFEGGIVIPEFFVEKYPEPRAAIADIVNPGFPPSRE